MQGFRTSRPSGDWRSFKFTHIETGATYTEGDLLLIQDTAGVLLLDIQYDDDGCKKAKTIVIGDEGVLVYHIEAIMVDKLVNPACTFLPGQKVYWSGVNGDPVISDVHSGFYWIGIARKAAGAAATEVEIDLKGDKISLTEPL